MTHNTNPINKLGIKFNINQENSIKAIKGFQTMIDKERLANNPHHWSEVAPEGATHYVVGSIEPWEKRVGDDWWYFSSTSNGWLILETRTGDKRLVDSTSTIIPRPSTPYNVGDYVQTTDGAVYEIKALPGNSACFPEDYLGVVIDGVESLIHPKDILRVRNNVQWDGGGLPPVGIECELTHPGLDHWIKCRVLAYHAENVIVYTKSPVFHNCKGYPVVAIDNYLEFRPIPTPEQRRKDELCEIASKYSDLGHLIAEDILAAGWKKPD